MENEYMKKCLDIYQNGGVLWLIERTDTNEYCYKQFKPWQSNKPETRIDTFLWSRDISYFHLFFLTKEDAERELQVITLNEGGCKCCGHGSTPIPILITEHEFVPPKINTDEKPYLEEISTVTTRKYNPNFGDQRICKCGHAYYRHFDTYEQMETVGCKYCQCFYFEE